MLKSDTLPPPRGQNLKQGNERGKKNFVEIRDKICMQLGMDLCRLLITYANNFDPGPYLDPKHSDSDPERFIFKKLILKKSQQTTTKV